MIPPRGVPKKAFAKPSIKNLSRSLRRTLMPEKYLKMRDKFAKKMGLAAAKTKAARLYNSQRAKGTPPLLSTKSYENKVGDKKPGKG